MGVTFADTQGHHGSQEHLPLQSLSEASGKNEKGKEQVSRSDS